MTRKEIIHNCTAMAILFASMIVYACAGSGTPKNTCLARVAALEVAITQSYQNTSQLYQAQVISVEKARAAVKATDAANVAADNAGVFCQIDEPTAFDYLEQAGNLLIQANNFRGQ